MESGDTPNLTSVLVSGNTMSLVKEDIAQTEGQHTNALQGFRDTGMAACFNFRRQLYFPKF